MPRYANETKEAVLQRMLDNSREDVDKRQGSVVYDLLSPAAIELAQAYIELDNVLTFGFATENTPGEYIDLRAGELGITRKPAVKATGNVKFSGNNGTIIAKGTVVYTDETTPVYFETVTETVIENGTATVDIIAVNGGVKGNVTAETISLVSGDVVGVTSVINITATEGGVDLESDESLLTRYYDRVQKPATSGNAFQYEQWAKSVAGVSDAKIYPLWNGNGTVRVVLLDSEKRSPSQTIIDATIEYIESVRPIGATVTVVGVTEFPIDVSATLTLADGADINEVTEDISTAITEYLGTLAFTDTLVRYTRIAAIILDIPRVIDYDNLTINGVTSNIEIQGGDVAVLGAVNFVE